jgi:NRPS condensation-like uncharacterized protein
MSLAVPAAVFEGAHAAARARNATVNDLFMAAYARAWARVTGQDRIGLPCTIDLRAFVVGDAEMGVTNLSGKCACPLYLPPDDRMDDTLSRVTATTHEIKRGRLSLYKTIQWQIAVKLVPFHLLKSIIRKISYRFPVSFSNTGIIDEDCVNFGSLPVMTVHISSAATPAPRFCVTLSTFRGVPTLTMNLKGDDAAEALARRLLAGLLDELAAFAASPAPASPSPELQKGSD